MIRDLVRLEDRIEAKAVVLEDQVALVEEADPQETAKCLTRIVPSATAPAKYLLNQAWESQFTAVIVLKSEMTEIIDQEDQASPAIDRILLAAIGQARIILSNSKH
jgi:hypothetical protein